MNPDLYTTLTELITAQNRFRAESFALTDSQRAMEDAMARKKAAGEALEVASDAFKASMGEEAIVGAQTLLEAILGSHDTGEVSTEGQP